MKVRVYYRREKETTLKFKLSKGKIKKKEKKKHWVYFVQLEGVSERKEGGQLSL